MASCSCCRRCYCCCRCCCWCRRTYFLPQSLEASGPGGVSGQSTGSSSCPCSRNAFHLFGLESFQHPPLTLDVCRANEPPPRPKKQQQQRGEAVNLRQQAANTAEPRIKQSIISSFAPRTARQQLQQQQQQADQEEEGGEQETEPQRIISGVVLAAVQGQVTLILTPCCWCC